MDLNIESTRKGEQGIVTVSGEVDVSNADALKEAIAQLLEDSGISAIKVEMADVPYIDSTGIGVLVGASHRAQDAKKDFSATGVQPNVARIFGMLGVDGIIAD